MTGTPTDGTGTSAEFGSPRYMAADHSGHLYITDTNGANLRSYDIASGWVGTLVGGSGGTSFAYEDGTGGAVRLLRPRGLTSDGTSLYWCEQTAHTIRQVVIDTTEASTLVGVRGCSGSRDGVGGDGTTDWSGSCSSGSTATMPLFDRPMGAIVYHFPRNSIFLLESGRLRRIQ